MLTKKKAPPGPVSVDAIVARIGGTAEELTKRYGAVGEDFMSRPMIAFEAAKDAYQGYLAAEDSKDAARFGYSDYVTDRQTRRRQVQAAASEAIRERLRGDMDGARRDPLRQAAWALEREAGEAFDEETPELSISGFREQNQNERS